VNGFLLDENLPSRLRLISPLPVTHSNDLGESPTDDDIWNFAKRNRLVIITKDADFSDRVAAAQPPPWVIHLRFGNLKKLEFHAFLEKNWVKILGLLPAHKLINVYLDRIESLA